MDIEQIVSIIPRRVHEWNQKDVEVWLTFIQLPQLIPKFSTALLIQNLIELTARNYSK